MMNGHNQPMVMEPVSSELPTPDRAAGEQGWWAIARRPSVVQRALKTSLVVGTILIGINHGDALIRRDLPPDRLAKMGLTYLVPYLVATFASVSTLRELSQGGRSTGQPIASPVSGQDCPLISPDRFSGDGV